MVKIINNRGQYKVTLPKELVLSKGWDENTRIRFVEDAEGNITIKVVEARKNDKK